MHKIFEMLLTQKSISFLYRIDFFVLFFFFFISPNKRKSAILEWRYIFLSYSLNPSSEVSKTFFFKFLFFPSTLFQYCPLFINIIRTLNPECQSLYARKNAEDCCILSFLNKILNKDSLHNTRNLLN